MNPAIEFAVQEVVPSLGYRELVYSLPFLEDVGVLADGSLSAMLVGSRLMDKGRVLQSGMKSAELKEALVAYTRAASGKPAAAVEGALLEAVNTARRAEWDMLSASTLPRV